MMLFVMLSEVVLRFASEDKFLKHDLSCESDSLQYLSVVIMFILIFRRNPRCL